MAEIRCPMCGRANPEDLDECQHCGARLKPLVAGQGDQPASAGGGETPEDQDQSGGQVPDWLARIRERASEELDQPAAGRFSEPTPDEEPGAEGGSGSPDWLSRLRQVEPEEVGPPPGDLPDWARDASDADDDAGVEEEPPGEGADESEGAWLDRLRPQAESGEEPPAKPAAPERPGDQAGEDVPRKGSTELPGWLDEISDEVPPGMESDQPGPSPESPAQEASRQAPGTPPPDQEAGSASGLRGLRASFDARQADLESQEPAEDSDAPPPGGEDRAEQPYQEPISEPFTEGFEALEDELPGWLDELEEDAGEGPLEQDELEKAELPSWVEDAQPESAKRFEPLEELDWDEDDLTPPASQPEKPEGPELPHVPALVFSGEDDADEPLASADMDLDAIELPEWLSEVQTEAEAAEQTDEEAPARGPHLAPATIPGWLEAMRPVETLQPVVEMDRDEEEKEEALESVGPLAGLRGVLMAEPVVAKPRTSTSVATGLEVTERQYAQADLLRRIVEDEQRELTGLDRRPVRWPFVRWILALAVVLAVGFVPITGVINFAIPTVISRDLGAVVEQVNSVPVDRPVLMVFDYEPGFSTEVQAVAGPLMEHLFRRDLNIVTVSTRPTGPPLALELVGRAAQEHGAEGGRDFLHLGYLSGGPSAVQLFSADPRFAVLDGFMIPDAFQDQDLWEQPLLRDVTRMSDFGMVIVIASGTDSARTWAEQAPPWLGDTPLLMVLSAGAEPLIRPYFEALTPTVDGILTGVPAGVYYEQLNGKAGLAEERWSAFGIGTFVIELAMLAGLAWGAFRWVMEFQGKRARG